MAPKFQFNTLYDDGGLGMFPGMNTIKNPATSQTPAMGPTTIAAKDLGKTGSPGMDYLSGGAAILGGLGDLANAYVGYKNYGLAKDQFGFEKAATNRDVFNQGTLINNQLANATNVGLGLAGNTMTDAQKEAERAKTRSKFVDTSAIG